jgi:tRNA pseudouridine13 synthase
VRIKLQPEDFRVVERFDRSRLGPGPFAIYRVAKRKWTTLEAAAALAKAAGVEKSAVSYAGLKDRQSIAVQYFSVEGGKRVELREEGLRAEFVGTAAAPIGPEANRANSFEIVVRGLDRADLEAMRANLDEVRGVGLPNYFDDQRFGCLRHGQGFVARELIAGRDEEALRSLLVAPSPFDDSARAGFKGALRRAWGDWVRCARIARGREHHTLFRHLAENPGDFRGAIGFIALRLRLVHLHAYQSYLWNRALGNLLRGKIPAEDRVVLRCDAGALLCPRRLRDGDLAALERLEFPLLAPETVYPDEEVKRACEEALAAEGKGLEDLRISGVPGFAFKAEGRAAWLRPAYLRLRPPAPDERSPGMRKVSFRFELPRGSYATLLLKRLFAPTHGEDRLRPRPARAVRVSGGTRGRAGAPTRRAR